MISAETTQTLKNHESIYLTKFAYTRFPILGTIGIRNKGHNPFVRKIRDMR